MKMDEEDFELLVQAVEDYKVKCERLQIENEKHVESIARLELEIVQVRDNEKESVRLIADLEQTVCLLDEELAHANESLAAAEEECAILSSSHDGSSISNREPKKRSPRGIEHNHSEKTADADVDMEIVKLERKLLEAVTNYKDLLLENKELLEIVSLKETHERQMDDEISRLTGILRQRDTELSEKDSEIAQLRARGDMIQPRSLSGLSDSDKSISSKQNSLAGAHGSPAIENGDGMYDRSKKDRSTSFEEYVDWRRTQTENEEKARAKMRGALFGPSPELAPIQQHGHIRKTPPATPPLKGPTDDHSISLTRTTSESTSISNSHTKKAMPPMSPPAELDLSHINLTPKRHSYAGSSPSTASSSLSSPYPNWTGAQSTNDKTPKFNSVFDSDSEDAQVSPLPVRRRQQSRSLSSFQDLFGYNSNKSAEKVNPKQPHGLVSVKTVNDMTAKPSKAESLRDVSGSADSGDEDGQHHQRGSKQGGYSKLYRSNTTLPVVSQSTASAGTAGSSSSRWASMGRHNNHKSENDQYDIVEDQLHHQESKEEDRFEILDSDSKSSIHPVQVVRGSAVALMHSSSVLPSIDEHGDVGSTGHYNAKRSSPSNDNHVAVGKSMTGNSGLFSGLVASKTKRTIIPMGAKQGSL